MALSEKEFYDELKNYMAKRSWEAGGAVGSQPLGAPRPPSGNALRFLNDRSRQVVNSVADDLARAYDIGPQRPPQGPTGGQRDVAEWGEPNNGGGGWGEEPQGPQYDRNGAVPTYQRPVRDQWHSNIGGVQAEDRSHVTPETSWGELAGGAYHQNVQPRSQKGPAYPMTPDLAEEYARSKDYVTRPLRVLPPDPRRNPELAGEWGDARQYMRDERAAGQTGSYEAPTTGPSGPVSTPPITPEIPRPEDPWEQQFLSEHGRRPTSYDRMVKDEMAKRIRPGQTPTQGDWIQLTRDLNRRGVYGPRDVPEDMPGFGRRANEPLSFDSLAQAGPEPALESKWRTVAGKFDEYVSELGQRQGQEVLGGVANPGDALLRVTRLRDVDFVNALAAIERVVQSGQPVRTLGDLDQLTKLTRKWESDPEEMAKLRPIADKIKARITGQPAAQAGTAQSAMSVEAVNRYFSQEFRVKQGRSHPLEGQGQMVIQAAQQAGLDPTLLLTAIEYTGNQGKRVATAEDVQKLAQIVKSATPPPEAQQIQQSIKRFYGGQSATGLTPQGSAAANNALQNELSGGQTGRASTADLARYTNQYNGIGQPASINERGIDAYLAKEYPNSPLRRAARAIAEAGETYNVDPSTLLAIMEKESGLMTIAGVGTQANNPGSLAYGDREDAAWLGANPDKFVRGSDGGKFLYFDTPEKGVEALAKLLGQGRYAREGRRTWGSMNDVYSSTARGDSPKWGEEVGLIAGNIKRYYGQS